MSGGGCLKGLVILCDAVLPEAKQELIRKVASLGGTTITSNNVSKSTEPSILIADSVMTTAYKACSTLTSKQRCALQYLLANLP